MTEDNRHTDVLILGGGVIGIACTHYLLEVGRSVRIVDIGEIGQGSSWGNLGLVTPSHAAPLAVPGMVGKALRWSLDPRSPFFVRPTLSPSRIRWFLSFAAKCNFRDFDRSAAGRSALLLESRKQYEELIAEHRLDCEWQDRGLLMVYKTGAAMQAAEPIEERLARFGVISEPLRGEELREREPALRDDIFGAHFYPQDAHLRPERLVREWLRIVRERGAVFEENCGAANFDAESGKIDRVRTERGEFTAKDYVVATGAWTPRVVGRMGLRLPIQPGKGYSVTVERPAAGPKYPMIFKERNFAVSPWPSGLRLGGTMEFSGYREGLNAARIQALFDGVREYLKNGESLCDPTKEIDDGRWSGWRPMTPDGMPFIGRSPKHRNLIVAAGHGMMGVSMAPATAKLVAAMVVGSTPPVDPGPYRLDRG